MTAPAYADDTVTVYLGDCRDVLADLADASVDAVAEGIRCIGVEQDEGHMRMIRRRLDRPIEVTLDFA